MKWLVGYQLVESDAFMNEILRCKDQIQEVYFSWGNMPNGRHVSPAHEHLTPSQAQRCMEEDLHRLSKAGLAFNLLLNGNCYGARSLSRSLMMEVCDTVDELSERFGLSSVTTTSPVLAKLIKENFPDKEVRASVNMEIGTIAGMEYLADVFDSFYIRRELNRDLPALKELCGWCEAHGKKSYLLANSGCLNNCSARQFHDNLVAHENEIVQMNNAATFSGVCGPYLSRAAREDKSVYLRRLNFIRPEDTNLYEGLVTAMKLATRVNQAPARVLRAYEEGHYTGNLLELLEPNHAKTLYPQVLENQRLPVGWGRQVATCGQACEHGGNCRYCRDAAENALVSLTDMAVAESSDSCGSCTTQDCANCRQR